MQIILVKYIQIICMTLSFSNQVNCDTILLNNKNDDRHIYETTACAANCMDINNNMTLEDCFTICQNQSTNTNNLKKIYENFDINILCRDNTSLAFEIIQQDFDENSKIKSSSSSSGLHSKNMEKNNSSNSYLYLIQIHQAYKPVEQQIILTNSSIIKVENLKSNTTYNISATIVHANREFSLISNNLQYSTLKTKYTPGLVKNISLVKYQENEIDKRSLKGIINWTPASDMTCYYDILFYPSQGSFDLATIEIRDPKYLYTYSLEPFLFDIEYTIGIRSKNIKDIGYESDLKFLSVRTPPCLEWHNYNLTICPPLEPQGLQATEQMISINEFSINITWEKPITEPDYYTIKILDLDLKSELDPNSLTLNVSKEQNNILIPSIIINGHEYEVYVTAYSVGGNSSSMIGIPLQNLQITPDKHHLLKLIVAIIVPLSFFALISMLTFIMCHRRARTKRYKERCKYFEELEKKAPMDPKSNFEFSTKIISNDQLTQLQCELEDKLFFNDHMELNRNDIKLYEVLGEGAFGTVRRGILKIDEKTEKEVAVKMLKDHPSIDDFKGFRSEIEVMKSVGKHPNIVSIIGHCTNNINDMMLLTEYCSWGNLLHFLRTEWNYINKIIYIQKKSMSIPNSPIELPTSINHHHQQDILQSDNNNKFNFDSSFVDKISLKYKNINDENQLIDIKNQINNNKNNSDDNEDDNNDDNNDNNKKIKLIVNNQGYDYNNRINNCTNFCKCHVNIIDKEMCLKSTIIDDNLNKSISTPEILLNKIHISNNCECNKYYIENKNNIIFTNNNENNKKDLNKLSPSKFDPLTVQNKGYYKYLQKNYNNNNKNIDNNNDNNDNNDNDNMKNDENILFDKQEPLTSKDLLYIAKQIAMGMEFLSKSKVVHRDLAARNVLVYHDRTIKIADFGLSRDVYQENVYKKTGNGKLPIKWLALESMTHQLYTTQSDVWSFGILLFEITTLGGTPYPAIPTNRLLALLKSGYRMERPKNCGYDLYNLMSSCWKTVPSERPTFTEICHTLDELLENSPNEIENLYPQDINKTKTKSVSDDSYLKPI